MKSATPAMIALLKGDQFLMAELYTFTLIGGAIYRYTSADMDITSSGNVFKSSGIQIKRGRIRTVIGVEVDTLDLTVYAKPTDLIEGVPFMKFLHNGGLDGAMVTAERTIMPTWGDTTAGTILLFGGNVSEIYPGRTEANIKVKSDLEILNTKMPKNLYQPPCINTLFDSGCGLTKAALAVNGTVTSGSANTSIAMTLSQTAGYFDLGTVTFLTGNNAGTTRNIKQHISGQLILNYPLPYVPAAGDTFKAYPGCDALKSTCQSKFNNLINFRGFPYIPIPETAL